MRIDNWKNLSDEIWLSIFERLSLKNQVRLACSCTRLYRISLDKTLDNTGKRALQYLKVGLPVPPFLAKCIDILRLPKEGIQASSTFVKEQIMRMENLQVLILEEARCVSWAYPLTVVDVRALLSCQHLREMRLPFSYSYTADFQGESFERSYVHAAIKSGNLSIIESLEKECFSNGVAVNQWRDSNNKTPTQLAIEMGNQDMIAYFVKKGGGAEWYYLSEAGGRMLSCKDIFSLSFLEKSLLYGSRLTVDFLRKEDYARFFKILETNVTLFNVGFSFKFRHSSDSERGRAERRLFVRDLAKALEKNTTLRILDLKEWKNFLPADITPLLHCERLEDLWLSSSLLDAQLESQQTFLHVAVHLRNIKLVQSFTSQGIRISAKDSAGRTALDVAREYVKGGDPVMQRIVDILQQAIAKKLSFPFGRKEWKRYFGEVGKEPPLPPNILELLEAPCPMSPGVEIADTHFLVLIPEKVNGRPLTLHYLDRLLRSPKSDGHETRSAQLPAEVKTKLGRIPAPAAHWVLMTKEPGFFDKHSGCREWRQYSFSGVSEAHGVHYRKPTLLEIVTSFGVEYVRENRIFDMDIAKYATKCRETRAIRGGDIYVECYTRPEINVFFYKRGSYNIYDTSHWSPERIAWVGVRDI